MRRIAVWIFSTVGALVLLFSYRTSTGGSALPAAAAAPGADRPGVVTATSAPPGDGARPTTAVPKPTATKKPTAAAKKKVVANGTVSQTRWGPLQVQITVVSGKITEVTTLQVPDFNGRDRQINAYAVPVLRQEALDAQSADIDVVSGATVTSEGYIESLQAALDAAHFGG